MRILNEEGVSLITYTWGISTTLSTPDYHRELARVGVWLGWDINNPLGRPDLPSWQQRTDYLKERLDEGLGANLMLSHDWNVVLSRIGSPGMPNREQNPDGYLWISRAVIPD